VDFATLDTRVTARYMAEDLDTAAAMAGAWAGDAGLDGDSAQVLEWAAGTAEASEAAVFTQDGAPDTPLRGARVTARGMGLTP